MGFVSKQTSLPHPFKSNMIERSRKETSFKLKRRSIPPTIDIGQCQPLSMSTFIDSPLFSPDSILATKSQSPRNAKFKGSISGDLMSPRTPTVLPHQPKEIPPINSFRGGLGLRKLTAPQQAHEVQHQTSCCDGMSRLSLRGKDILQSKKTCVLCLDQSMLTLNGIELQCGHYVHSVCIRELTRSLADSLPICSECGSECVPKRRNRTVVSSCYSTHSASIFRDDQLNTRCDVDPLKSEACVHPSGPGQYELLIQVCAANGSAKTQQKYVHTQEETAVLDLISSQLIQAASAAGMPISLDDTGGLRLVSSFILNDGVPVTAHLFSKCIIVTSEDKESGAYILGVEYLEHEDIEVVYDSVGAIAIKGGQEDMVLAGSATSISAWLAAINDPSLSFPIDGNKKLKSSPRLAPAMDPVFPEFGVLSCVLCTPVHHVPAIVPKVLETLGPQDRLGLVVVSQDGSCAWLMPHKPSWKNWCDVIDFDFDSCDFYSPASTDLLSTAITILGEKDQGRQHTVIVVSGCPIISTTVSSTVTLHSVALEYSPYDLGLMTKLAEHSSDGQFHSVTDETELATCCARIAAAERTYVHRDVTITLAIDPQCQIVGITPKSASLNNDTKSVRLGSIIAGQSRTISVDLKAASLQVGTVVAECSINSVSAITGEPKFTRSLGTVRATQAESFVARVIFFDRLVLVSSAILRECLELAMQGDFQTPLLLMDRASSKIRSTVSAASKTDKIQASSPRLVNEITNDQKSSTIMARSEFLALGLDELKEFVRNGDAISHKIARIYEAVQNLEHQCSVIGRSLIEKIFFESLECNRF